MSGTGDIRDFQHGDLSENLVPEPLEEEFSIEPGLRPRNLSEYIGQEDVKRGLTLFIQAARKRGRRWITVCSTVIPALERQHLHT